MRTSFIVLTRIPPCSIVFTYCSSSSENSTEAPDNENCEQDWEQLEHTHPHSRQSTLPSKKVKVNTQSEKLKVKIGAGLLELLAGLGKY